MSKVIKKILKILKEKEIEIYNMDNIKELEIIYSEFFIFIFDKKKKELSLDFNITSKPDDAARFALDISYIAKEFIFVNDVFLYDINDNLLLGEKAKLYFENELKNKYIQEYINDQQQKYILYNIKDCPIC